MSRLCDVLLVLAAACVGIYAGAMLTEGCVLVPYWRSLPPAEFFAWYAANDARLLGFFGPLTAATTIVTTLAAACAAAMRHPGRSPAAIAAALVLFALATFFVYFETANASFTAATAVLPGELGRWATWHWTRTVASLVALGASLVALRRARAGSV